MKNVAIVFGGRSCEREISILTGVFTLNLIDRQKYVPVPVYVHSDGRFYSSPDMFDLDVFKKKPYHFPEIVFSGGTVCSLGKNRRKIKPLVKIDVALNCCHGGWGEGGGVSALTERLGIPSASPKITESAVFLDKGLTKLFAKALSVPTGEYFKITDEDYKKRGAFFLRSVGERLKYPVVVKPVSLGSSIGVTLCYSEEETRAAVESVLEIDRAAIVERYLKNKSDVNCAAYLKDGEIVVSEPEIASSGGGIYSFSDKYDGNKKRAATAELSDELRARARAYTRTIYKRMNVTGVVRMDYLLEDGELYLGEVNTVPGSLAYYLFCERISDAKAFFSDLIEEGLKKPVKRVITASALSLVAASGKRGVRI